MIIEATVFLCQSSWLALETLLPLFLLLFWFLGRKHLPVLGLSSRCCCHITPPLQQVLTVYLSLVDLGLLDFITGLLSSSENTQSSTGCPKLSITLLCQRYLELWKPLTFWSFTSSSLWYFTSPVWGHSLTDFWFPSTIQRSN